MRWRAITSSRDAVARGCYEVLFVRARRQPKVRHAIHGSTVAGGYPATVLCCSLALLRAGRYNFSKRVVCVLSLVRKYATYSPGGNDAAST